VLHASLRDWLARRGFTPFEFQERAWRAHAAGESGLLHAPTGTGKTLAAYLGAVSVYLDEHGSPPASAGPSEPGDTAQQRRRKARARAEPLRVLWITPLRALAADTASALREPIAALGLPWNVETRTGDTPASLRAKQRKRLPTVLVTTPESLTLMLTHADARTKLAGVRTVVVDEWHELLSSKRGVQTELALARLRRFAADAGRASPSVWGLSATIANIEQAARSLVGSAPAGGTPPAPTIIAAQDIDKKIVVETLLPEDATRHPWSGHLGLTLLPRDVELIDTAQSSLLFCNTRSQVELWFKALLAERPDWLGRISLHHGSVDREIREKVEQGLREGRAKCVVCTSSLDLGVDFSPVELVMQVGSPKGVARLLQRAGRSGHSPGAVSRVVGVPAHTFELIEFAAARNAAERRDIEAREPFRRPIDVLAQHMVTVATGEGFDADDLFHEVRTATAYADLTREQFDWALDFVTRGGPALDAYPAFKRVIPPGEQTHEEKRQTAAAAERAEAEQSEQDGEGGANEYTDQTTAAATQPTASPGPPRYRVASRRIATAHRLGIGTITSDQAVSVRYNNGRSLGTIEESFISKLTPGQRFVFAGNILELVRLRDMTATVRRARSTKGVVPRWGGGRSPLSTRLAEAVRKQVRDAAAGVFEGPEMTAARPVFELQRAASIIPDESTLLIELVRTRDGHHAFLFPFEGRQVHEGLGSLVAHRLARLSPQTVTATPNDYGLEVLSSKAMPTHEHAYRALLSSDRLLEDLLECLNSGQLARRAFRDIARVAGLIHPGYPGSNRKPARHLQASSDMFFDVLADFDPESLLLDQARREVLDDQLEVSRLRRCLDRIATCTIEIVETERLTPFAFPLFAERLRTQMVSSESFRERIERIAAELDEAADRSAAQSAAAET
jgi:ATP-dependent Lhr-like helicase